MPHLKHLDRSLTICLPFIYGENMLADMLRNPLCNPLLTLLVMFSTCTFAQVSLRFSSTGISLTTPGAPFKAERVTRTVQRLSDGSSLTHEVHETLSRDAEGRFLDEGRMTLPAHGNSGAENKAFFVLADPVAKTILQWTAGATTATSYGLGSTTHLLVTTLESPRNAQPPIPKGKEVVTTEDLGTKPFAGLVATGVRTLTTIPADTIGNNGPLVSKHDVWTSAELKLVVAEDDESPFSGMRHSEFISMKRTVPDAALFLTPVGIMVKPAPSLPGIGSIVANMEYTRLLAQVAEPQSREDAAIKLVAYAKTHPEVQNHVAHVLAARNTHLDDAETLAQESVDRVERQTGAVAGSPVTVTDLNRMELLAEYWDSLGWVRYAKGDLVAARRYCEAAWEVGGEGLYLGHVAKLDEQAGDNATAAHRLEVAMSGKMDDREQEQTKKNLIKLGVTTPHAVFEPTEVSVAHNGGALGSEKVYLVFVKDKLPRVLWISDQTAMTSETQALKVAKYPDQIPDGGDAHVVREGKLTCVESGCSIRLMYAWESVKESVDGAEAPRITLQQP
jgi:hypothetical protein